MKQSVLKAGLLALLFTLAFVGAFAQTGVPAVENFAKDAYRAEAQNWTVSEDADRILYFANNGGLLSFDGRNWRRFGDGSSGRIRSVRAVDGRIYTGGFESLGYWEKDDRSLFSYVSLVDSVLHDKIQNEEVWNIVSLKGVVYFQTFSSYIAYDGKQVSYKKLDFMPLAFLGGDGCIYATGYRKGLYRFDGNRFELLVGVEEFGGADVTSAEPIGGGRLLLSVGTEGLYLYENGKCRPWAEAHKDVLKKAFVNKVVQVNDSLYAVGTRHAGLYFFDGEGRFEYGLNKDNGLQNNTVLGLMTDSFGDVWATLDNGISRICLSDPFRFVDGNEEDIGAVYDVCRQEQFIYFGTNQGLYRYRTDKQAFDSFRPVSGQVWSIAELDGQIICGYNEGTVRVEENRVVRLSGQNGGYCIRKFSLNGEDFLLQGTYTGLSVYRKDASGRWSLWQNVRDFAYPVDGIEVDHQGTVWAAHAKRGFFRIRLKNNPQEMESVEFYPGLSGNGSEKVGIFKFGGRVVLADGKRLYTYNDLSGKIVPYDSLNKKLGKFAALRRIIPVRNNRYWLVGSDEFALVVNVAGKLDVLCTIPFSQMRGRLVSGYENIRELDQDSYLFCLENGACVFRYGAGRKTDVPVRLQWRGIRYFGGDTLRLPAVRGENSSVSLDYEENNRIEFDLAFPFYGSRKHLFRYRLSGLGDEWRIADGTLEFAYSRIPYGSYVFEVEVYDGETLVDSLSFPFRVAPPFYASPVAIAVYVLLFLAFVLGMRWLVGWLLQKNRRKYEEEKARLLREEEERRRLAEIRMENEKLEAELLYKSKEIAGSTMMVINKNKILQSVKEELAMQKEKLGTQYPAKYYKRIISLIDSSLEDENDWQIFQSNFDRIHEGFFRKLKENYPSLTANDLKLCAYLRLNLSTKDIAHLMNISVKGVEMARYRIRKKLNLKEGEGLVDFMIGV